MLLVYFVLVAFPLGYLMGGHLRNMKYAPLRFVWLPCLAFLLEASFGMIEGLTGMPPQVWLGWCVCLEYLLLALFVLLNLRMKGMKLLGLSTLVNFAVISANGFGMPVTPLVYESPRLTGLIHRIQAGELPEYVLVDWDAPLWFLGDTIPLGSGLASVGDLLMGTAILIIIIAMMKARKPSEQHKRKK